MSNNTQTIPGIANGTVTKGQLVKYAAGGWVACSSQGEKYDGVAFNDATAGEALAVQVDGLITYKCGGTGVADGVNLTTTAGGLAELAASSDNVSLKAIGATVANAYGTALRVSNFVVP